MAKVQIEMTGDEVRAWRALAKLEEKNRALTDELRNTRRAAKDAGSTMQKELQAADRFATGLAATFSGGVVAGIGMAKAALEEFDKMAQAAADRIAQLAENSRALFQLAGGPELKAMAEELRKSTGMSGEEATSLTFRAASAGQKYLSEVKSLVQLREIGINGADFITGQQKIESAFGVNWSTREFSDKILAAAGPANVRADELAQAMSTATVSASAQGFRPEQLLAFGSVFSDTFKNPEAAAERIKALSESITKHGGDIVAPFARVEGAVGPIQPGQVAGGAMGPFMMPTGGDLAMQLHDLASRGQLIRGGKTMSATEFLGESNAIQGLEAATSQVDLIRARERSILGSAGLTEARLAEVRRDPQLEAVRLREVGTAGREVAEEQRLGTGRNLADALQQSMLTQYTQQGQGAIRLFTERKLMDAKRLILGDEGFLSQNRGYADTPELRHGIGKFLNREPAGEPLLGDPYKQAFQGAGAAVGAPTIGANNEIISYKGGTGGDSGQSLQNAAKDLSKAAKELATAAKNFKPTAGVHLGEDK